MSSVASSAARPTLADRLGRAGGKLLAPLTGTISRLRRARMFHPDGVVYTARVDAAPEAPDLAAAAERVAGPALARLSSAWWRGRKEWRDALGFALRLGEDQDLLFATIRFPWTTPVAPLATHQHGFLWDDYDAVSPFLLDGVGRVKLRLASPRIRPEPGARAEQLERETRAGAAVFVLQVRRLATPWRVRRWEALARVELVEPADIDQEALRFWPFKDGRGLHPTGFVHHLREAAYAASQRARPRHAA